MGTHTFSLIIDEKLFEKITDVLGKENTRRKIHLSLNQIINQLLEEAAKKYLTTWQIERMQEGRKLKKAQKNHEDKK